MYYVSLNAAGSTQAKLSEIWSHTFVRTKGSEQAPLLDEKKEERHSFEVYQVCHGQNVAIMELCFVQNCIGAHIA